MAPDFERLVRTVFMLEMWVDLAALLAPQAEQGGLVIAHDCPGVRSADKLAALGISGKIQCICSHLCGLLFGIGPGFGLSAMNLGLAS